MYYEDEDLLDEILYHKYIPKIQQIVTPDSKDDLKKITKLEVNIQEIKRPEK
jgi:hypothetical protein